MGLKIIFQLMNNAVYGNTLKNVRNGQLIELASDKIWTNRLDASGYPKTLMVAVEKISNRTEMNRHFTKKIFANKPIYIEMSVLDLSKTLIYDFHRNVMKKYENIDSL
ncbi:unnamed protein product [Ixodes hexagonus]